MRIFIKMFPDFKDLNKALVSNNPSIWVKSRDTLNLGRKFNPLHMEAYRLRQSRACDCVFGKLQNNNRKFEFAKLFLHFQDWQSKFGKSVIYSEIFGDFQADCANCVKLLP